MNDTITAVPGIEAGHYTDLANGTGCTVVLCRDGAAGGVDVRGGSPGTRETNLLEPARRVDRVFAVVLSGGSAFGLDAASGGHGVPGRAGHRVQDSRGGCSSNCFLGHSLRPRRHNLQGASGPARGPGRLRRRRIKPLGGRHGGRGDRGHGCQDRGSDRAVKGGIGSAALVLPSGHVVGATVAVNAIGGIWDYVDGSVVAGPRRTGGGFDDPVEALFRSSASPGISSPGIRRARKHQHRSRCHRCEAEPGRRQLPGQSQPRRSGPDHSALPHDTRRRHHVRHGHGGNSGPVDIAVLGAAAVEVTARAVLRGVRSAAGLGGFPSAAE